MIRVVAPSRLHFGLFRVPTAGEPGGARAFGVRREVDRLGGRVRARARDDRDAPARGLDGSSAAAVPASRSGPGSSGISARISANVAAGCDI